jgi:hypothetical protein
MEGDAANEFRFRKNDSIGSPGAEEDRDYLPECFVDTGDLDLIERADGPHVIILGRTGAGKSALIERLAHHHGDRVVRISPHSLALTYIADSTVLNFFNELGINLYPFYKLLWRHVFTVEILTRVFSRDDAPADRNLFERLGDFFSGATREEKESREAAKYLEEWGRQYWRDSEDRVKEITRTIEDSLERSIEGTVSLKGFGVAGARKKAKGLTEEEKIEVTHLGQEVVSKAQVRDLHHVFTMLERVLEDRQKTYYLVLDGLDENWVEDSLRYKLVMALMETAKEFIQVRNAKIVLALHRDLMDRVFRRARDAGFQEEKFQGLCVKLLWTRDQILDVLDRRINLLVRRRYTKASISHKDLLPETFCKQPIGDFIYSICSRPREVIALFNCCIENAVAKSRLTSTDFNHASVEYSKHRLQALRDEWHSDYPTIVDCALQILRNKTLSFKLDQIDDATIADLCLDLSADDSYPSDLIRGYATSVVDELTEPQDFRRLVFQAFYRVGLVGLKTSADAPPSWVNDTDSSVSSSHIDGNTSVAISPKYALALGVQLEPTW